MSLLETLKAVKQEGYDPRKDKINPSTKLETGIYPVKLIAAERVANKAGYEEVSVQLEVVSGEAKGRREFINLGFNDNLPEFVLSKNAKILLSIIEMAGIKTKKGDLDDEESTAETLQRGLGNQFKMDLKISPNKNRPEYPYRNYEFSPLEEVNPLGEDVDDDLPF